MRKSIIVFCAPIMVRIIQSLFLLFFVLTVRAQNAIVTQTIRGVVIDKVSQAPMQGAVITIVNSTPLLGASTNEKGEFVIKSVPVGRQTIKATFIGYKPTQLTNITVNSGKELVLTITMEEDIMQANEVVVKANVVKNKPLNEMSTVSTRTFSVEETQKFAAAVNDPARMATSFAGVVGGNDGNNMISVRGNSPNALLWRMEGVEIPNPNHFSNVGTSGGGISILSAQLLSNSDFLTGAFASEYGNALGGVFDLRLRKGNNQKREYTFQAGVLGIDVATEGPIKKGYDGSYLINYRYSTLSLLEKFGLNLTGAATNFQDLSFNVNLPTKKLGTFGFYGMGGISTQTKKANKDSAAWLDDPFEQYEIDFKANTGVIGLNNTLLMNKKSVIKSAIVFSGTDNTILENKLDKQYGTFLNYNQSYKQTKLTITSAVTSKINAKNSIKAGVIVNVLGYHFLQKDFVDSTAVLTTRINNNGTTQTMQAYGQWQHKFTNRVTTNVGLHTLYLGLNKTYSIEPRASVKYDVNDASYLALGYGLHGQIQPLGTYFAKNANGQLINDKLAISKAHHLVLTYDFSVNSYTHIKLETYYQHLFNIPVSKDAAQNYSLVNATDGFTTMALSNKGIARNYGLELTAERFLHKNFYYLLSTSLYQSQYRGEGGTWYNTMFNTSFATTFTAGKEWNLKNKNKVIGINTKVTYVGGLRYTPIDLEASNKAGEVMYDNSKPFSVQNPNYFRMDIRFSLKRNYAKHTNTLSLDLQNATNHQNVGGQYYDENAKSSKYWYQLGILPVLAYRIEF